MNQTINGTNSTLLLTSEEQKKIYGIHNSIPSICYNLVLTYCLVANRKKEWAKKTKQLFSLVLSDLFASIVMIPQTIFTKLNVERTYELCAAFNFSVATTQTISCHHILSLCIHRWVQIRRVHLPSNTDTYRYNLESCVIWISLVLISMPPYYFW